MGSEEKTSKSTKYLCAHSFEELDSPNATPCCSNCDPETGKCTAVIKQKSGTTSSSRSSGTGGIGTGKVYRFTDTSGRGRDFSPYETEVRPSPESSQEPEGCRTRDDCGRDNEVDSPEIEFDPTVETLEAYERYFDKRVAESVRLGDGPIPEMEEIPDVGSYSLGLKASNLAHFDEFEETFEEEAVNRSPLPPAGECTEAISASFDSGLGEIELDHPISEVLLESESVPPWEVVGSDLNEPLERPFGSQWPNPIDLDPPHDPYDFS